MSDLVERLRWAVKNDSGNGWTDEMDEAANRIEELFEHIDELLQHQDCACGVDNPTDICLGHLPMVTKLKARIEELEALHAWQDISTAPKDGTRVLVWRPEENKDHPAHMGVDRWSNKYSGAWWQSRRDQQPTHWKPLPTPPGGD